MSKDDMRWAEQLLERARAMAAPRPEDGPRNIADIEARLGMAGEELLAGSKSVEASRARCTERWTGAPAALRSVGRPGRAKGSLAQAGFLEVGVVLAFGVCAGITGYVMGRADAERTGDTNADPAPAWVTGGPQGSRPDAVVTESTGGPSSADETVTRPGIEVPPSAPAARGTVVVPASPRVVARPAAIRRARPPASASIEEKGFSLSEALQLLRRAEEAVRRFDGLEARMWLSDLDRQAPPQLLLEERLVTRALANCLVGDVSTAVSTLRELEASNPESIYRARLEGSCVAESMQRRRGVPP